MKTRLTVLTLFAVACSQATSIDSRPGLANSLSDATVAIGVHPWWQPNFPDDSEAVWISYADTGYDGAVYQPNSIPAPAVAISQDFVVDGPATLRLKVWADNTTWVFLDGLQLVNQKDDGPAFFPDAFGLYAKILTPGAHLLTFEVLQGEDSHNTLDNPFGLLYTGTANSAGVHDPTSNVPEPASFVSIGIGLLMMWRVARIS